MSLVPIIKCSDVEYSLKFYTKLLDFQELECESDFSFAVIARGDYSVALSSHQGDGEFGFCMMVFVADVDEVYRQLLERGLDVSLFSGVHREPIDQTWGLREFYVDDPDCNTVRFVRNIEPNELAN
jgi:hypothetical protein